MNKRDTLFYILITLFIITIVVTLLGVTNIVDIDEFYLKGLFSAFLIELAAVVFNLVKNGNLLAERVIENNPNKEKSLRIFANQSDANDHIKEVIKNSGTFQKATIIQYSSDQVKEVVYALLTANVQVDLFLHNPETAFNLLQKQKIDMQIRTYCSIYRNNDKVCNHLLKVYLYDDIGSVRAIKLDEDILMLGHYIYLGEDLYGHDKPVFVCESSNKETRSVFSEFGAYIEHLRKSANEINVCTYAVRDD